MKCKNCKNYLPDDEWCPKKCDSPDIEMERECNNYECMTNADRIRNMTNEELASIIMCPNEFNNCAIECYEYGDATCRECSLVWLQKEVE